MRKEVLRTNSILCLILSLEDEDPSVQRDGREALREIPEDEKRGLIRELDRRVLRPELAERAVAVLQPQL